MDHQDTEIPIEIKGEDVQQSHQDLSIDQDHADNSADPTDRYKVEFDDLASQGSRNHNDLASNTIEVLPRPKEEDKQFFNINQEEINQAEDRGDIPDSESPDPDIQPTPVKKTHNRRVWQQVPKFQRYTRSKGSTIATPEAEAAKDPGSSSLLSQSKLKDLTQPPGEINSAYLIKGLKTFRYIFATAKSNTGEPQSLKEALAGPDIAK